MLNIAVILGVLFGTYLLLSALPLLIAGHQGGLLDTGIRGRISLAFVFVFTSTGHFIETQAMVQMVPPAVPIREAIIYASGVLELCLAVGLLVRMPAAGIGHAV
jgi:hypothetical protein